MVRDKSKEPLNEKQELFCLYYVKDMNALKAYQKAYEAKYETALTNAYRLMKDARIKKRIRELKGETARSVMLDSKMILQKWIDIATSDISDFLEFGYTEEEMLDNEGMPVVDEEGNVKKYHLDFVRFKNKTSNDIDTSIVESVKQTKHGVEVKLADKTKALEYLSKFYDVLREQELKELQIEKEKLLIEALSGKSGKEESALAELLRNIGSGNNGEGD